MYAPRHSTPSLRPARTTLAALAVPVLAGAVLAGCTGGGGGSTAPGQNDDVSPSAATSATPAPTLPASVTPAPIPTKVANDPDDRKNVVLNECKATKGGWGATGTATNAGKSDVEYAITVFFTTTSATTIDSAKTTVKVKPGETVKWTADKDFSAPKEMLCVLRGVAAT